MLPSVLAVARAVATHFSSLAAAFAITAAEAAGGLVASIFFGVIIALFFAQSRWVRRMLYPYTLLLQTVPIVAIAPLILMWVGAGPAAVGFIALGGVASEIGVVMLVYINQAVTARAAEGKLNDRNEMIEGIVEGAALRVRPIAMTVAVIIAGLLPIMWGSGTGSEVMRRIAAPMVGGMITAPLLSMFVVPAAYLLIRTRKQRRGRVARHAIEPSTT